MKNGGAVTTPSPAFTVLVAQVRACTLCAAALPHGVRPVIQIHPDARVLIASQAPGRKVHETGIPFNDASGERLRAWMGIGKDIFYDDTKVAILPMGFCFPGTGKSGDLPPRPECAPAWRSQLLNQLQQLEITLLIGQYAQAYHFGKNFISLTETVKNWENYWPHIIPLPHPSPRNMLWLRRNPWFEAEIIPALQTRISDVLKK
jgi:uracil-DNA glycosylase